MAAINLIYVFGILFFILSLEDEREMYGLIYAAVSFFINTIAYFLSYTVTDFVTLAYLPLMLIIASLLLMIYRIYGYLPKNTEWGDDEEQDYRYQQDIRPG